MKLNLSVTAIALVVTVTVVAAAYRVTTAPERIRARLDAARASCLGAGGEWVKVGNDESCRPLAERKKI